jgi:REP element-mobilizing transposase RayT
MPRLARLDAPGVLQHIMIRGIELRVIFRTDQDQQEFLNRLAFLRPHSQTQCYAWVLMKNYVHLLLRSGVDGISQLIRKLKDKR